MSAMEQQWAFLESLSDGVYGIDADGRCLFINAAALQALGYGADEPLIGRNMHELIHHTRPDGSPYPKADCPLIETAKGGKTVALRQEMLWRRDGTPFYADYSSYPMPASSGIPGGIVTFKESIELNAEREGARLASPDCVMTVDASGLVLAFNRSAEATFGRSAKDMVGRDLVDRIFPPEARVRARERISETLAARPDAGSLRWLDTTAIRADGTVFPAELSLFRTETGPRSAVAIHLRDATSRHRDRALMRQSEARFITLANGIPQLSWMTDADGSINWYNQRWYEYTGAAFEDMAGWGWRSVHHPDHLERVERRFRINLQSGEPWEDTFPLRAADGSFRWFLSRAMPIRDDPSTAYPDGRIIGWFGTNTDITVIRDAEQRLEAARDEAEAANRAKSTFIANMSHELRTPLSAIIGYSEMLSEEIEEGVEPTDLARDVQKIEGNARHLLGLINDVLDLSKVESGKMEAYTETFELARLAEDIASTVDALMEKKNNTFELILAPDLGTMHSDVTRIRQVLLNLLSNAAKFTEGGTITLSVSRDVRPAGIDRIRFVVSDAGIGMTEEQLAKLFQRFQQADSSTTRQFGGTGLGLALTKAFVQLLAGEIKVTSEEGVGSRFEVILPALLGEVSTATPASQPVEEQTEGRDIVLVVDDDETQRELMSRFLIREGYAARTAADGPTGLDLAKRLKPRAILLDVTMPGMDGWSVLSALKADPDLAAIPVVMVTFVSERALASSLGAADYVIKPVDWTRLRHVMEAFRDAEGDVLVVDDEEDTRHRSRQALEKNGWSVVEAANGRDGLAQVARAIPRVILLDLNMPVMDGFDFLKELRARPGCADIPVVVLTALDLTAEDRRRLRGANQVLNKGETPMRDLVEKLRRLGATDASAAPVG